MPIRRWRWCLQVFGCEKQSAARLAEDGFGQAGLFQLAPWGIVGSQTALQQNSMLEPVQTALPDGTMTASLR